MGQRKCSLFILFVACLLVPRTGVPQGLTGTLIGTVKDQQGGALPGAQVTLTLAGPHRRSSQLGDQRERAAAVSGLASRSLRARNTDGWLCAVS